jgi:hypothetical protein
MIASRTQRRLLLLTGLALWLAAAFAAYQCRRYLYNVLLGPFPIDRTAVLSLADADSRLEYFVTVEGDEVQLLFPRAYTGGEEPYSMYGLLRVGEKWLLLRVPNGKEGCKMTGTLESLSAFERDHILAPRAKNADEPRVFLPFRLEATRYFRTVGWLLAVVPISGLVVLGAWLMRSAWIRRASTEPPRAVHWPA